MEKYNLSAIMKRAWELVKKAGLTISSALRKSWAEAKCTRSAVTFKVCGKETFTVNAQTGIVTGKTYNSRKFLKDNFNATWDGSQWTVDVDKFNNELDSYAAYYNKYIVSVASAKEVSYTELVNRNDGFYMYSVYTDGTHDYVFVG